MGQMLRGGRSSPSDSKLGGGASRRGKTAGTRGCRATVIEALTSAVAEQDAAQRLHLESTLAWW